jgi:hypothetical protein
VGQGLLVVLLDGKLVQLAGYGCPYEERDAVDVVLLRDPEQLPWRLGIRSV